VIAWLKKALGCLGPVAGALCLLAAVTRGAAGLAGAFAGVGVALLDLALVLGAAAVLSRRAAAPGKMAVALLLSVKFPVLAAVLWALLGPLGLDAAGLMLGFGSLPLGLVAAALAGGARAGVAAPREGSLG